ncbi:proline dehydrogenase 2, mitochondrial-like isoform X1 [Rhododendron vialii]|uniref:proline dehydrogenase 2, mitochondrial-like isoform X1 n=1 Tax=Rhododendron vialii TaxID=182163 RepID=UPI00265D88F8|nr:proline dehydrogenase 2, mitochondrial-like isoform X1 [Rhododendron vialii]
MAHRVACPKIIQRLRPFAKPHYSAAHSSITATVSPLNLHQFLKAPHPTAVDHPSPTTAILDVDDVKGLFSSVSTGKLLRSAVNLHAAAVEPMIDLGMWVMNSKLMRTPLLREATVGTIKHTFYDQFCAGPGPAEAARTAARIWDSGLKGMLVYALEHASDNESCDRNLEGFLETVESAKSLPTSSVSFVVVKITAICPLGLLKRVSDLLRWEYNNESFQLPWKLNTLPIFADSSPFYHTPSKPDPLTVEEETDLHLAQQRMLKICQSCIEANVPLTIDAEDTSVQPGIDYFTYSSALMYNVGDNPIIYGTIQTYLTDAKERLIISANAAEKMGVPMGFKLVRGAYMSSERHLATSLGVESPIHNTIDQTHACFNDCTSFMLEKIASGSGAVIIATHNMDSGNKAAAKARDLGIQNGNQKLQFAQLYGMADGLSFGLKNAGFQVSKYMPFGPVELVMPYLLRRAEENRGLLSTSTLDRYLMRKELKRRLKAAIL